MPRRELVNPQWDVTAESGDIVLELVVPGSKFGAVDVRLDNDLAREIAAKLVQASETKRD